MSGGVWTLIALLFEPGRPGAALRKVSRVAAAPFPRAAARRRVPPAARPWLPCWPHSSWPNPAAAAQAGTRPARSRPPRCRCRRAARSTRPSPRRRSPRAWLPPLAPVAKARQACARVSCSDFEEHAGSRERRPAESTFLAALGLSLRVRPRAPAVLSGRRRRACAARPVAACPAARQCAAAIARQGAQSPAPLWYASGSAAGWPGGGLRFPDMRVGAHAAAPRRQRLFRIAQRMMRGRRARRRTSARWRARSRRASTGTRSTAAPAATAATCSAATAARPPPTRPASAWAPRPRCAPGAARCPLSPFCSTRRARVVRCLAEGARAEPPCCAARRLAGAALQGSSALLFNDIA